MYKYKRHEIDDNATPELQELQKLIIDKSEKISDAKVKILKILKTFGVEKASSLKETEYRAFKSELTKLRR